MAKNQDQQEQASGQEEPSLFDWDAAVKRAADMPDILPKLQLEANDTATVTVLSDRPRIVTFKDKTKGNKESTFPVIEVQHHEDRNAKKSLGIGAISMQNGFGKIAAKRGGSLEGVTARVTCITYAHPKFGKGTIGYRVEELETQD